MAVVVVAVVNSRGGAVETKRLNNHNLGKIEVSKPNAVPQL